MKLAKSILLSADKLIKHHAEESIMSLKSLLTFIFTTLILSSQAFARPLINELAKKNNCEVININISSEDSATSPSALARIELVNNLKEQGIQYELNDVNMYETEGYDYRQDYPTKIMKNNSVVLDLSNETDMTGSEIKVSIYKIDSLGNANFVGAEMAPARSTKKKKEKLVELSKLALMFACGV
jgi:hypothetical protein